mgnify:FL=1
MTSKYPNIIYKRLNKELSLYNSLDYKYNIEIFTTNINNNEQLLVSIKNQDQSIFFELLVPRDYPFKPYNYFSSYSNNNYSYFKHIQNIHETLNKNNIDRTILEFFYNINYQKRANFLNLPNKNCFCCNSILCYSNWSPSLNIINILNEIEEIKFIEKYKNKINYNKLKKIYYNNYIINLPDDIYYKILSYIIL